MKSKTGSIFELKTHDSQANALDNIYADEIYGVEFQCLFWKGVRHIV